MSGLSFDHNPPRAAAQDYPGRRPVPCGEPRLSNFWRAEPVSRCGTADETGGSIGIHLAHGALGAVNLSKRSVYLCRTFGTEQVFA